MRSVGCTLTAGTSSGTATTASAGRYATPSSRNGQIFALALRRRPSGRRMPLATKLATADRRGRRAPANRE